MKNHKLQLLRALVVTAAVTALGAAPAIAQTGPACSFSAPAISGFTWNVVTPGTNPAPTLYRGTITVTGAAAGQVVRVYMVGGGHRTYTDANTSTPLAYTVYFFGHASSSAVWSDLTGVGGEPAAGVNYYKHTITAAEASTGTFTNNRINVFHEVLLSTTGNNNVQFDPVAGNYKDTIVFMCDVQRRRCPENVGLCGAHRPAYNKDGGNLRRRLSA